MSKRFKKVLKGIVVSALVLQLAFTMNVSNKLIANGNGTSSVKTLYPQGAITPTGTWNLGTRAGDFVNVAGMRGIDPETNKLVQGDYERIKQAFLNMKLIAESEGASLQDATRLIVYVTDMYRFRPLINQVQQELWGEGPYPPRTIVEVDRLNQDDIVEVEGTFYAPISGNIESILAIQDSNPSEVTPLKPGKIESVDMLTSKKGPDKDNKKIGPKDKHKADAASQNETAVIEKAPTYVSPNGVITLFPKGAITPTGTWNLGTRAGDLVSVAGMRGIDPETNQLVEGDYERIKQAFLNMKLIAESEGASLQDATRLVVYVTDMFRYRPLVNQVQQELWGDGPYPPRTIVEVDRLNQDDIFEVEGTFYAPENELQAAEDVNVSPNGVITLFPEGAITPTGTWNLATIADDHLYVAGMRGINPVTNQLVEGDYERIKQAFLNMKLIAESEGATLQDATRLIVYVTDMYRFRPLVNQVQEELWGSGPYPPRTIIEVDRLNQDDIFEVEGTFFLTK